LQAALLGVPLVVVYKLFPLTYWIGRLIVKVKYISLVNILSGREVVKELLQSEATAGNIASELRKILSDGSRRKGMMEAYTKIKDIYSEKKCIRRVAGMVGEMGGMEKIILIRRSRSQIQFTTNGTEKVSAKDYAVIAGNLRITAYCLLSLSPLRFRGKPLPCF